MGVTLPSLLDFIESAGPTLYSDPTQIINDAALHTYSFWRLLLGRPMSEVLQGGSEIRDDLMLTTSNTFSDYQIGDVFSYVRSDILTRWKIDWRFNKAYMIWHDQEVVLNGGQGQMTEDAMFQQYKVFWDKLQRQLWTDVYNGLEAQMWAVPDKTKQEAPDGKTPYSLPCFICEETNTLPHSQTTAGPGGAWTTVENIDPTAVGKTKWRNQINGYAATHPLTATTPGNLGTTAPPARTMINALDDAIEDVKFIPPNGTKTQYFESAELNNQCLFTTKFGKNELIRLMRQDQDSYVSKDRQDAHYGFPKYAGFDIVRVEALETTALYKNATTGLVTEGDTNAAGRGPRIYVTNGNYIRGTFHKDKFFEMTDVLTNPSQPFTHVKVLDLYTNNACRSRARHSIVTPGSVAGAWPNQTLTPAQVYPAY